MRYSCLLTCALLAISVALPPAASADLTVRLNVNVNHLVPADRENASSSDNVQEHRVTLFYKGARTRTETDGSNQITIYDGIADKIYTMDTYRRTFYVVPLNHYIDAVGKPAGDAANFFDIDSDLKFTKSDDAGIVSNHPARRYALAGNVQCEPKHESRPPVVIFPGWGYPGGHRGFLRRDGGAVEAEPARAQLEGDVWFADDIRLPREKHLSHLGLARILAAGSDLVVQPMLDQLNKMQRIPLKSRIKVTLTPARQIRQAPYDDAVPLAPPLPDVTVTTLSVESINADAVDAGLFVVPGDFTEVLPPAES
ncbi:MAG: hypothetical protein P4L33_19335 [Capsulimonadaceae bacterium]|nr:hypothetical protein [Capsulimonadaceae bacterium]